MLSHSYTATQLWFCVPPGTPSARCEGSVYKRCHGYQEIRRGRGIVLEVIRVIAVWSRNGISTVTLYPLEVIFQCAFPVPLRSLLTNMSEFPIFYPCMAWFVWKFNKWSWLEVGAEWWGLGCLEWQSYQTSLSPSPTVSISTPHTSNRTPTALWGVFRLQFCAHWSRCQCLVIFTKR